MTWIFLISIGVFFFSIASLLERVLLKEEQSDPFTYSIVFQLVIAALLFIFSLFTGFHLPPLGPYIPYLFLMAVLYSLVNWLFFKGLKTTEASETAILFSAKAISTMIAAIIFLKEPFDLKRILGMFLIISAITIISWRGKGWKLKKGDYIILASALLAGVAFTNDAFLLNHFEAISYSVIAFLFPPLLLMILRPKTIFKFKLLLDKRKLFLMIITCFFLGFGMLLTYTSYQLGGDASQIIPISQSATVLIVILAFIFLKERSFFIQKIIGSILAFIGVLLLII